MVGSLSSQGFLPQFLVGQLLGQLLVTDVDASPSLKRTLRKCFLELADVKKNSSKSNSNLEKVKFGEKKEGAEKLFASLQGLLEIIATALKLTKGLAPK